MEETRLDLREQSEERWNEMQRTTKLLYKLNQAEPFTEEYVQHMKELFGDRLGENSMVQTPIYCNLAKNIHIGNRVMVMPYFRCMSAGNVYIDDEVRIAMNVAVITNNHDLYDREILLIQDVHICRNAWIGAGVTILPGVTIGENAVVGAGSIVTKDIPANTVAVGSPAKVIKELDADKFL